MSLTARGGGSRPRAVAYKAEYFCMSRLRVASNTKRQTGSGLVSRLPRTFKLKYRNMDSSRLHEWNHLSRRFLRSRARCHCTHLSRFPSCTVTGAICHVSHGAPRELKYSDRSCFTYTLITRAMACVWLLMDRTNQTLRAECTQ